MLSHERSVAIAGCLLALASCQSFGTAGGGGGYQTTGGMGEPVVRHQRPTPRPDPLDGIALSDSQRVRVDSIRATYWLAAKNLGGPGGDAADDFDNLVKRELVDVRLVLTRAQRELYDRHLAEKHVESEPDH